MNVMETRPLIKVFRTPRKFYFFDVNKNSIVNISEHIYAYLSGSVKYSDLTIDEQNVLEQLYSKGYFSDKRIKKLQYCTPEQLKYWLEECVDMVILQITQACNLRCSYCAYADVNNTAQRSHSGKRMSWETAKKAVDFLRDHSAESKEVAVSFYGGEPTLEFDLVKKIVSYAEEQFLGRDLRFSMTTNATVLTDEIIKFIVDHKVNVMISLDGPKPIHDRNRPFADGRGSFDKTFDSLRRLVGAYKETDVAPISINMVLDPQYSLDGIERLLSDPVFKKVVIQSTLVDDTINVKKNVISPVFQEQVEYADFLSLLSYLHLVSDIDVPSLSRNNLAYVEAAAKQLKKPTTSLPDEGAPSGPCVPGQHRLFVSTDGTLYPCERVSETSECMKIGSLNAGIDYEKADKLLNIAALTPAKCRNCWAQTLCTTCCRLADENGTLSGEQKNKHCWAVYNDASAKIISYILQQESRSIYAHLLIERESSL